MCLPTQVRLAEKDAQLMGGFGEMSRLRDMEDDLGIPMVMMPPSRVRGGGGMHWGTWRMTWASPW